MLDREVTINSIMHVELLLDYLRRLRESQRFTDVIIQCDGIVIDCCHRLVLGAFSRHFENALATIESKDQVTLDIDPAVTGVQVDDLRLVFEFMYTGQIVLTDTLFKTSKALGISSLTDLLIKRCNVPLGTLLTYEGHAEFLSQQCRRYYQENKFTDVAIHCESSFLRNCHRIVLSAYSEHFEAALANTEGCPFVTLEIDADITGVSCLDLRIIVDFMYYGLIRTPRCRIKQLISAGRALGVAKFCEVLILNETTNAASARIAIAQKTIVDGVFAPPGADSGAVVSAPKVFDPSVTPQIANAEGAAMTLGAGNDDMYGSASGSDDLASLASIADDELYDEYVMGPRRKRNPMGTYRGQMRIKSVNEPAKRSRESEANSLSYFDQTRGLSATPSTYSNHLLHSNSHSHSAGPFQAANVSNDHSFVEEEIGSVTLSLTAPLSKRRRFYYLDAYGYGLPEIVGGTDVTVSLLVGDQQLMMEKPFKCPYCDHRTKEKSALEKHVRCIHTMEAPYKCQFCNQLFKVQSNLVRHIRAHTGEKPYVCKKCGSAYADKKNMDAHVFREHLKMRPLECPATGCSAKFWRQDRFNYHCRRQHNIEPPDDHSDFVTI